MNKYRDEEKTIRRKEYEKKRKKEKKEKDKKPVKNSDLWQRLDELAGQHRIRWCWVRGHAGQPGNERADALANRAMDELRQVPAPR